MGWKWTAAIGLLGVIATAAAAPRDWQRGGPDNGPHGRWEQDDDYAQADWRDDERGDGYDDFYAERGPGRGPDFDRGPGRGPGPDYGPGMRYDERRPGGPPHGGPRGPEPRREEGRIAGRRPHDDDGDRRGPPPPPHMRGDHDRGPHRDMARHDDRSPGRPQHGGPRGPEPRHHDDHFADRGHPGDYGDRRGPPPPPHRNGGPDRGPQSGFTHHDDHGPRHHGGPRDDFGPPRRDRFEHAHHERGHRPPPRHDDHRFADRGDDDDHRGHRGPPPMHFDHDRGPRHADRGPHSEGRHGRPDHAFHGPQQGRRPFGPPPFLQHRMLASHFGGHAFGPPAMGRGHFAGRMPFGPGSQAVGGHHEGPNPMALLDADHDGKISKDEVLKHFAEVDANHDDSVTMEELQAHMRKHHEAGSGPHHGDHQPGPRPGQPGPEARGPGRPGFGHSPFGGPGFGGPRPMGPPSPAMLLEQFDKNKDGKLSKDEAPPMMWDRLSKADTDSDGQVTAAELEAHFKAMHERRPGSEAPKAPESKSPPAEEKKESPAEPAKQADADFGPVDALTAMPTA